MKKVVIGMSGGVDSSVAAILLKKQGYDVIGLFMRNWDSSINNDILGNPDLNSDICPQEKDYNDALKVCEKIGIPLHRIDFVKEYWDYVFTYFLDELKRGRTPNPDIMCNKYIKFDMFAKEARKLGADYIATGHYAINEYDESRKRYLLKRPADRSKDQTYVLYSLTQNQLAHTLFPIGNLEKSQVREIAEEAGLVNSKKPDSQDICFVPDGDYASFIRAFKGTDSPCGDFVDVNGKILGKHKGIINYTIGQRKGLGIALGKPVYVVSKDIENNKIVIGNEADLYTSELVAEDVNIISQEDIFEPVKITAKTRYSQTEQPATLSKLENGDYKVVFDNPQRAVTKGQAVVFYDGDIVVGGGTIK